MKRKGFTLIELLAVIIILAVIALITIPMLMRVIENSRKEALKATGRAIYEAGQNYQFNKEAEGQVVICSMFEFGKDRTESETIDGITYEPVSKLSLKGEMPKGGYIKVCNGKVELAIDNGENTYIKTEVKESMLDGPVDENDITDPEIISVSLKSTTNTITVIVEGKEEDGTIEKYYYSINEEGYKESEINNYVFRELTENVEYEIKVQIENGSGLRSTEYKGSIKTSSIGNPSIDEVSNNIEEGYEWATERVIGITYMDENIENPEYYLKSDVEASVEEGVIISECGSETEPGECSASSVTILEANKWYQTTNDTINVTYTNNGTLYALTSDGTNTSGTSSYKISKTSNGVSTAPEITGGSTNWSTVVMPISISTESEESSGVKNYEYCISTINTSCDGEWTGLESGETSVTIGRQGISYIYFRAIGNNGKVGEISQPQTTMIDTSNPNVSASVSGKVATLTVSDSVGVTGYGVNQSTSSAPTFTPITSTTSRNDLTWTATAAGTYVAWVTDASGRTATATFTIAESAFCAYSVGQVWNFSSVGSQTFTVPSGCSGTYQLEVWGAQGWPSSTGGKGGYSKGNKTLTSNQVLYIEIGGRAAGGGGGHNGGGTGGSSDRGGGGGATHIATGTTNRGVLANYASYKSEVLIVAGGGGGGTYQQGLYSTSANGGAGGGTTGGTGGNSGATIGVCSDCIERLATGGSQTSGGLGGIGRDVAQNVYTAGSGSFGTGGEGGAYRTGGGGGWYGGGAGSISAYYTTGGGGGSGYIGGVTSGSMSNGQRTGTGYATITLKSLSS